MKRGIGQEFLEKTKYQYLGESDQQKGLPQPPLAMDAAGQPAIDLPRPDQLSIRSIDLTTAINRRRSVRKYAAEPLTLEELSYLLWCTQGVKQVTNRPATLRTVPSAGARHPFETYLLINRVQGLQPGLYRFLALTHQLVAEDLSEDIADRITAAALRQPFIRTSAVTFLWVAVPYRSIWRYQERAYRYLFLDAGHVCQNLYLAAEAIDCGCCAVDAFDDDRLNQLLGLDGVEQFAIYLAPLGKKDN